MTGKYTGSNKPLKKYSFSSANHLLNDCPLSGSLPGDRLKNILLIRADAGPAIGSGHVMRCLALAEAWKDDGGEVIVLLAASAQSLEERLSAEATAILHIACEPGSREDAGETVRIAREYRVDRVVIDGYHFGAEYQTQLRDAGLGFLVIDDYGHAAGYYANLVLNLNMYADPSLYPVHEPATRFLLGTRYALLRREFLAYTGFRRTIPPVARKILVTFGGGDPDNLSGVVTEILKDLPVDDLEVVVIAGGISPHLDALRSSVRDLPHISIRSNVTDMPRLMAWADMAISAGGSTSWELAFMGLPSLLYTAAANQARVVDTLVAQGMAERLTNEDLADPSAGLKKISGLLLSGKRRQVMSRQMHTLVDGEGASRVTMCLRDEPIRLRAVREEDSDLVYQWINDPDVRVRSFRTHSITPEEPRAWFASVLADPGILYFIAVDRHDRPVGQARFRIESDHAVISVLLEPTSRNQGLGSRVIGIATRRLFSMTPVQEVHAFIKTGNESSFRAFAKAGYARGGMTTVENQEAYLMKRGREI